MLPHSIVLIQGGEGGAQSIPSVEIFFSIEKYFFPETNVIGVFLAPHPICIRVKRCGIFVHLPSVFPIKVPVKSLIDVSMFLWLCFSLPDTNKYFDLQSWAFTIILYIISCTLGDFGNWEAAAVWIRNPFEIVSSINFGVAVKIIENSLDSSLKDSLSLFEIGLKMGSFCKAEHGRTRIRKLIICKNGIL